MNGMCRRAMLRDNVWIAVANTLEGARSCCDQPKSFGREYIPKPPRIGEFSWTPSAYMYWQEVVTTIRDRKRKAASTPDDGQTDPEADGGTDGCDDLIVKPSSIFYFGHTSTSARTGRFQK